MPHPGPGHFTKRASGVQAVLEMLETELGRVMGCCGTPNLAAISRAHVKVHAPAPALRTDAVRP